VRWRAGRRGVFCCGESPPLDVPVRKLPPVWRAAEYGRPADAFRSVIPSEAWMDRFLTDLSETPPGQAAEARDKD